MAKNLVSGLILANWAQILAAIPPPQKIWLRPSLDILVSYHTIQYQKKLMVQFWKHVVEDGRQTDGSDFIGRCPTKVEGPTSKRLQFWNKDYHTMIFA